MSESISVPKVLWLIGLSGAGKSTLGDGLAAELTKRGIPNTRLDGDTLRTGLNSDLGFSREDRAENLRRSAHVANLLSGLNFVVICSFITPNEVDRAQIRRILGDRYVEVFVRASLAECERRDPKGLYRRARAGQIPQFTGIGSDFEPPVNADVVIDTEECSIGEAVDRLVGVVTASLDKVK